MRSLATGAVPLMLAASAVGEVLVPNDADPVARSKAFLADAERRVEASPQDCRAHRALMLALWRLARRRAERDASLDSLMTPWERGRAVYDHSPKLMVEAAKAGNTAIRLSETDNERAEAYMSLAGLLNACGQPEAALNAWRLAERYAEDRTPAMQAQRTIYQDLNMEWEAWTVDWRYGWYAARRARFDWVRAGTFAAWMAGAFGLLCASVWALRRAVGPRLSAADHLVRRSPWARGIVGVISGLAATIVWLLVIWTWNDLVGEWRGSASGVIWFVHRTLWIGLSLAIGLAGFWLGRAALLVALPLTLAPTRILWTHVWWLVDEGEQGLMPTGDRVASMLCLLAIPLGLWLGAFLRRRWDTSSDQPS